MANLDRELALMRVGGDLELLREIAALFLENYEDMLSAIEKAIAVGDPAALEMTAHSLKGSVANFGAEHAVQASLVLEATGRTHHMERAAAQFVDLRHHMQELRPELEQLAAEK